MTFGTLALIAVIGLLGPLLALSPRWRLPVVLGELAGGLVFGVTGFRVLHPEQPTFTFLGQIGFALVMFVAGTHVPVRDPQLRAGLPRGIGRLLLVAVAAVGLGIVLATAFRTGHGALYAVLMASSSAALILPIISSLRLDGRVIAELLPQLALADTACIVAVPLVIDPARAPRAALGTLGLLVAAFVVFLVLRQGERTGLRHRVHRWSEDNRFAVELRINLAILFALAFLAVTLHTSVMLAGFAFGLGVNAIGEPRRLARQVFAVTEGFLGPIFFVWLGASLNLRDLGGHPRFILLGVLLGVGALVAHLVARLTRQPLPAGMLACAQMGVPVAAVALGTQLGALQPGEGPAMMLGAVITIAFATAGGSLLSRRADAVHAPGS